MIDFAIQAMERLALQLRALQVSTRVRCRRHRATHDLVPNGTTTHHKRAYCVNRAQALDAGGAKQMDSGSFKRVTDGWVYRAPNPWIFGDAPHYRANDAQKAQIQALMIPFEPAYFVAILALGIFVWTFAVKGIVEVFYGHLDDAQKAQIEAIFIPRRPALLATLRFGGAGAWAFAVGKIVEVVSGHDEASTANLVAIAVLFAISLVPVAIWLQRRRLEPILAGLPLTQERITRA